MTDEPDEPEDEGVEVEPFSDSEFYEVSDGYVIFPRGAGCFADEHGASAVRVRMGKPGEVDVLVMEGEQWVWRDVTAKRKGGKLMQIKTDKQAETK